MREEDSDNRTLTDRLDDFFDGHPYTWDFNKRSCFLILDYLSREEDGVGLRQENIIVACGLFLNTAGASNSLRAAKISISRRFDLDFIASGNGDSRAYLFKSTQQKTEVRGFMRRRGNSIKRSYLIRALYSIPTDFVLWSLLDESNRRRIMDIGRSLW